MELLALAQAEFDLGAAAIVDVQAQRHDREPLLGCASHELVDLCAVEEQLAVAPRLVVVAVALLEGRDMGTVVFPKADLKIFLTGNAQIRAKRRFDELRAKFPKETENLTLEQTLQEISQRDAYDTNREISPLKKAPDAYEIDTSKMTIPEIVLQILEFRDSLKSSGK